MRRSNDAGRSYYFSITVTGNISKGETLTVKVLIYNRRDSNERIGKIQNENGQSCGIPVHLRESAATEKGRPERSSLLIYNIWIAKRF